MFKRIISTILFLFLASLCFAQGGYKCPYCNVHVEYDAKICWLCRSDLTEYWREVHRKMNRDILAYAIANYGIAGNIINEEKAKKAELNKEYLSQANSVINDLVDAYGTKFTEIEKALPQYYESHDKSVLDRIRGQFNSAIVDFVYAVRNCSGMIDECDGGTFNRLNSLVDMTNSIRRKIESAKAYVPDEFAWGLYKIKKKGNSYQIFLPESFSSSSLVVPATINYNYTHVPIVGLADNTALNKYSNLESIEYQGNISVFDASQHNNCPKLKSITFSGSLPSPPLMTNGKALREDIKVYVSQDALRVYGSTEGWDASNLVSKENGNDLYARNGIVYNYDKRNSQVSIEQYLKNDSSVPSILPSVNGAPVTRVGNNSFAKGTFKTVEIPSTVTEIGDNAFSECTALEKITIPGSVRKIGNNAFRGCLSLKDVVIEGQNPPSADLTTVPSGCWITVGEGLLDSFINNSPYDRYKRVRELGSGQYLAYDGSQIYLVTESDNTAKLIKGMDVEKLVLSDRVIDNMFYLTGIGSKAFDGCGKLSSLTIPSSVKTIEPEAFFEATNLSFVYCLGDVPPVCDKAIFQKKNTCCVYVPVEAVKAYKKEKGWKSADKIVGADAIPTDVSSRSVSAGTVESARTDRGVRTSKVTASGLSASQAASKWASVIFNPTQKKHEETVKLRVGSSFTSTFSNFTDCIIEDPDIVELDNVIKLDDGRTKLVLKPVRSGNTYLYVIINGKSVVVYHIKVSN